MHRGRPRISPGAASGVVLSLVAGAGFEPATSGRDQGRRDGYGLWPEATGSLGVVRDWPSLPVTEYPTSTEWDGPNLDSRWTPIESHRDASGFKDGSADEVRVVPAGYRVDSPFAKVVAETGCVLASMRWADLRCDEPSPGREASGAVAGQTPYSLSVTCSSQVTT